MTTPTAQPVPLTTPLFVRHMRNERYQAWRQLVEGLITATGVRPALVHLEEGIWVRHFAANEDAFNAVVAELNGVDG
jgi:hypothetical protein